MFIIFFYSFLWLLMIIGKLSRIIFVCNISGFNYYEGKSKERIIKRQTYNNANGGKY